VYTFFLVNAQALQGETASGLQSPRDLCAQMVAITALALGRNHCTCILLCLQR
jgi:hypothetical protein